MLIKTPKPINIVSAEFAPKLTKGRGAPTTGNIPETIPKLTKICRNIISAKLPQNSRPNCDFAEILTKKHLARNSPYSNSMIETPNNPNSSAKTAIIKSV
jgi:hypothetical protein